MRASLRSLGRYAGRRSRCQCLFQLTETNLHTTSVEGLGPDVRSIFGEGVVWIAVEPAFARLGRRDHRMSTCMRVFAGVPIRRAVATKCDSACLACPKMHPVRTDLYALFTFTALRMLDRLNHNRIQM